MEQGALHGQLARKFLYIIEIFLKLSRNLSSCCAIGARVMLNYHSKVNIPKQDLLLSPDNLFITSVIIFII